VLDSEIKNYKLNTTAGADLSKSVGPSAEFVQMPIAFNYRYVDCLCFVSQC
jgi:general transcription factor 3C polypeptide 5 (transcription factor C subunit 1)